MENDVLTTSQAAKLLGISVRTAQLLVEGGSLRSWKTPGGHRRVYRDDVLALMKASGPASAPSPANAILIAAPARMPLYERLRSEIGDIAIEAHSDEHAAAFAIGARLPAAVIVDLSDHSAARLSFARQLSSNPSLGHTRLVTVGPSDTAPQMSAMPRGHIHIASPDELPDTLLRAMFAEPAAPDLDLDDGFPVAANEAQRLAALDRSGLVGTLPEPAFDRLTWLASQVLQMPVSLMTLLTPSQQWFKSRQGLEMTDTPRSWAFCNQTILQRDVFEIDDLAKDTRFGTNPAVAGAPHFRFYAGAPVIDPDGYALGSVCVMDYVPRNLDQDEKRTLLALAAIASDEVRLRTTDRQLRWTQTELERSRTRAAKR
jgi:excisionase family DNA binding protein